MRQTRLASFWFPHSEGHNNEHAHKIFKWTHIFPLCYELFLCKSHQQCNSILFTFKNIKITGPPFFLLLTPSRGGINNSNQLISFLREDHV